MAKAYRGLTWDHPRGRDALRAAAAQLASEGSEIAIEWDVQPLEGFESRPIDEVAEAYDVIVLDHPHLGEALAKGSLLPLDDLIDAETLTAWSAATVGHSFASYAMAGHQWAIPLDAATQVAARRADLIDNAPDTWQEVIELSRSASSPVALSLAGPHAFLTFASLCFSLGSRVGAESGPGGDRELVTPRGTAVAALEVMIELASRAPAGTQVENPIVMLERMSRTRDIAYIPLIFGYVNYSSSELRFADAPRAFDGAPRGSAIGGTGLALSRRCDVTDLLVAHLAWLMSDAAQRDFIPAHNGQPSLRSAWKDDEVNAASAGFYRHTLQTIETAFVRPRYDGFIAFQGEASAIIREIVSGELAASHGMDALDDAYRRSSGVA